jgi:hypothetical protein
MPKPTALITYVCSHCDLDSAFPDTAVPFCYYCERNDGLSVLKREPLTQAVLSARLKTTTDRLVSNLKTAKECEGEETDFDSKEEEKKVLDLGYEFKEAVSAIRFKGDA